MAYRSRSLSTIAQRAWGRSDSPALTGVQGNSIVLTNRSASDPGDEAGTAPGDRRFRPDVEGLRAVSIVLVVLYHAGVPGLTGGFVGVDVFFVISGFVITGLLLRERNRSGGTSVLNFYARRCRRIIPAATATILVTVAFAYFASGLRKWGQQANDCRWAAGFSL